MSSAHAGSWRWRDLCLPSSRKPKRSWPAPFRDNTGGMTKTIFAKIIDREIPATIVYEDDQALSFKDIYPAAPTHVLVIPKKPIDRIQNMTRDDEPLIGHLIWVATEVARKSGLE